MSSSSESMEANAISDLNPSDLQIFILSGQSNMAGRGGVFKNPNNNHKQWDGVVPPDCLPNPSILRLTATLRWEPAAEPLHADIDVKKVCGVGPGMSFANRVIRRRVGGGGGGGALGLVPCAVGGTAIKEWARGEKLYEEMVKRAKESVKKGKGNEIKALLWYQGESDASSEVDAESYKANMEKLIHNVREDLNLPSLPIIQVALASGDEKYMEKVREAQKSINISNVVCVDAKGLELKEDHLHLTTHAQVLLGHMLADAYLAHFAAPPLMDH
ncbi:putative carbohydrate esterase [Senna tora]|uniref:Putative carbohydrate esterase n=1 Tax=Senna tora TaxID=362788 RepID=A0A835CIX8_9FABA|nr:putative carbohydrate esterase [Senna tora]